MAISPAPLGSEGKQLPISDRIETWWTDICMYDGSLNKRPNENKQRKTKDRLKERKKGLVMKVVAKMEDNNMKKKKKSNISRLKGKHNLYCWDAHFGQRVSRLKIWQARQAGPAAEMMMLRAKKDRRSLSFPMLFLNKLRNASFASCTFCTTWKKRKKCEKKRGSERGRN